MARRRERPATDNPLGRTRRPRTRRVPRVAIGALMSSLIAVTVSPGTAEAQQDQWWHAPWQMSDVWQTSDGAGVTVAVIDSGVDASIPDLSDAILPGLNLLDGGDNTDDYDENGHGTAMASLIASRGRESGVLGVAPAASILPVVVGRGARGPNDPSEQESTAIRSAVDHGAQVINISGGSADITDAGGCPDNVAAAVRYALSKNVVVVAASGNRADGRDEFPGACPGVLTVAALRPGLELWEDSHRSEHVDVAAPGPESLTLRPGGETRPGGGTSAATAVVSGVVALVRAEYPDASAREVVARVLATVEDLGDSGRDDATGYGMVRPYEALTADVPADAPNPVFDNAGDLTDVAPPSPDPTAFAPDDVPDFGAPPAEDDGSSAVGPIVAIAAVGGLVLITAAIVIAIVVARSRRRHPHPYPPGPPAPPYGPGPPGPR